MIAEDVLDPSENLIRYYVMSCHEGKITARVIDLFRTIVKRAFSEYISDQIARRLETVRQTEEIPRIPEQAEYREECQTVLENKLPVEPPTGKDGIVTHNTEVWAYVIVRTLLREVVDPSRIVMRDQKSYCSIILDNNRKPICRLYNFEHFD